MDQQSFNPLTKYLVKGFQQKISSHTKNGMTVNPFISEFASWYERIRNAMEYREDEVILRATIERILKRRLILGGTGSGIAEALVRELIWARYFSDGSISHDTIEKIAKTIDCYLELGNRISRQDIPESKINEWIYHLMSSEIEHTLNPNSGKEAMANFMFHVFKNIVKIEREDEETTDAQIFIAIRRSYAKDDIALLRYQLFLQYFGALDQSSLDTIGSHFTDGFKLINQQLTYPLRNKIYLEVKKFTPAFLILEDILRSEKGDIRNLLLDEEELLNKVFETCEKKYKSIISKVHRAIVRSVVFILLSKAVFALAFETAFENIVYGKVLWTSMAINIVAPSLLMILAALFIKTPNQKNTIMIFNYIKTLLFDPHPQLGEPEILRRDTKNAKPFLHAIFTSLWITTFALSFGVIIYILSFLHFNVVSKSVFIFFLAIVSFLSYRINQTAHLYTVEDTQGFFSSIIDFFFIPIVQAGRYLTEGITQINVLLFILDFIIETPFKGLFAFAEQWFVFLRTKREELE